MDTNNARVTIDREAHVLHMRQCQLFDWALELELDGPWPEHCGLYDFWKVLIEEYKHYKQTGLASDLPVQQPYRVRPIVIRCASNERREARQD